MIRGTTARFKFKLPCPKGDLIWAKIKFWQPNNPGERLPIYKTLNDCSGIDDVSELCISLTAEETVRFSDKYKAKIELLAYHNGVVFGNKDTLVTVYPKSDDITSDIPILPEETNDGFIILNGYEISDEGGSVNG